MRITFRKFINKLLIAVPLVLLLLSCSLPKERYLSHFDSFVSELETNYETMSEEEWLVAEERYDIFVTENFEEVESELSNEDKLQIGKLKGRFLTIKVKRASKSLMKDASEVINDAKGIVDEIIESLND